MTRRNKVRLAVSRWKASKSQEWQRCAEASPKWVDLTDAYSFDAIYHLYRECSRREAGIQEFFSEGNIVPLIIVYEDFIQEYEKTVRKILGFIELDTTNLQIPVPALVQTADTIQKNGYKDFVRASGGRDKPRLLRIQESTESIFLILTLSYCIVRPGIF